MIEKLKKVDNSEYPYIDEEGVSHKTKKGYLQQDVLDFCGCGDPDDVMLYVAGKMDEIKRRVFPAVDDTGHQFFLYWLDHKGFAEHGSSVGGCWLTELGEEVLADINWCLENEKDLD